MNKTTLFVAALALLGAAVTASAESAPHPLPVTGMSAAQNRSDCVYANKVYSSGYILAKQHLLCHAGTKASHNFAFWTPATAKAASSR